MCHALQSQGAEVLIATTNADFDKELPVVLGEQVIYQDVPTIFFSRQWSEALKYSRPLAKWLNRGLSAFDLVHIHAVFSHACIAAGRGCRRHRKPYLVRPLGTLDPWSLKQKRLRKRLFWHLGVKQMLAGAAAIHYTAEEEKRLAECELGLGKGVVVPNGIDLSFAKQQVADTGWLSDQSQSPYVLALSRMHPKKGYELLIESFAVLKQQGGYENWRLIFAGDGDAVYINQLKQLAARNGLNGDALFIGWVAGSRKYDLLRGASLLALPSYQENFGISLVEAMAYGVPVLVSPHVNLAPEIVRADAGWVTPLDQERLTSTLAQALGDGRERRRKGDCALVLAQGFGAEAVARKLLNLYKAILIGEMGNLPDYQTQ